MTSVADLWFLCGQYVVRDTTKASKGKEKSADTSISKREDHQSADKIVFSGGSLGDDVSTYGTGM